MTESIVFIESDILLNVGRVIQYIYDESKLITLMTGDTQLTCDSDSWSIEQYAEYVERNNTRSTVRHNNDVDINIKMYNEILFIVSRSEYKTTKKTIETKYGDDLYKIVDKTGKTGDCINLMEIYRLRGKSCFESSKCGDEEVCDSKTLTCQKNVLSRLDDLPLSIVRGFLTEKEDTELRATNTKFELGKKIKRNINIKYRPYTRSSYL